MVSRRTEGVNAPAANAFSATWIIFFGFQTIPPLICNRKVVIGADDIVASGSNIQHINFFGIGRKQIGQSSLAGKFFFMLGPMIPLTCGVAILGLHTRLASLETSAPLLAALSAAAII